MRIFFNCLTYLFTLFLVLSCSSKGNQQTQSTDSKEKSYTTERYQQSEFSLDKPKGWQVACTGSCHNFAFAVYDTSHPEIRAFFIHTLGPVYLNLSQKKSDLELIRSYGFNIPHFAMPVINPFTPTEFVSNIYMMLDKHPIVEYQNICPAFENPVIISAEPFEPSLPDCQTQIIRLVFTSYNQALEGLLIISISPELNVSGENMNGMGNAYVLAGICAPTEMFEAKLECLLTILETYHLDESVYEKCIQGNTYHYSKIMKSGKWLGCYISAMRSEWKNRNENDDDRLLQYSDSLKTQIKGDSL